MQECPSIAISFSDPLRVSGGTLRFQPPNSTLCSIRWSYSKVGEPLLPEDSKVQMNYHYSCHLGMPGFQRPASEKQHNYFGMDMLSRVTEGGNF